MVLDWNSNLQGSSTQHPSHVETSPSLSMLDARCSIDLDDKPFRLFDLQYEIRNQIFFFSICSTDNYWLDRDANSWGASLRLIYLIRERIK